VKDERAARKIYIFPFLENTIQTGTEDCAADVLVELV
jgi:hypothetical protein